jgi:hypothetical protein
MAGSRESWTSKPSLRGSRRDLAYVFPRHPTEIDRLDIQHYALREAFGVNYLAPIQRPVSVLDVGCGSGQWAFDLCSKFSQGFSGRPRLGAEQARTPGELSLRQEQPAGRPTLPRRSIRPIGVRGAAEVMGRGGGGPGAGGATGWLDEVGRSRWGIEPAGPATKRLFELGRRVGQSLGLVDMTGVVFSSLDERLQRAGKVNLQKRSVDVPIGEWGGRLGSLMATDCRAMFTRLTNVFKIELRLSTAECNELLQAMTYECEEHNSLGTFAGAVGQSHGE